MNGKQETANPQNPWRVRLYGDFSLATPAGIQLRLPDRKVEGLLALLVLHREFGIDRGQAAEILWPGKSPTNLANLRQALSVLRRSLGEAAIEASRSHCRLSTDFPFESDYEQLADRKGSFMPGHDGDWFDEVRMVDTEESEVATTAKQVVAHFYQTLEWFAIHDRLGLHALLCARPSMVRGLHHSEVNRLMRAAPEHERMHGWAAYWDGTAEEDLAKCAEILRNALRFARQSQDATLASEACLELGKVYCRTGQLARALKICDIADSVADAAKTNLTRANAKRLRGTVLVHWQDQEQGLELLRQTEDLIEDPIERLIAQSARAFFEASTHRYEAATETLQGARDRSRELGHSRIEMVGAMTNVMLLVGRGELHKAVPELQAFSKEWSPKSTQFTVYADELLAKLLLLEGDRANASKHHALARKGRLSSQMVVTRLEADRVSRIA